MPPEPKSKRPTLECAQNGPYLVGNLETFENSHGDAIGAAIAHEGPALVEVISDAELI